MKRQKATNYIDNDEFMAELVTWRDSAEKPEDRMPSERLGQILLDLHDGVLKHQNFRNYKPELKEELKSYSLYRILKCGLKSFKFDGKHTPFAYFTRSIFLNYYTILSRYYKRLNAHEEYVKNCLTKLQEQGFHGLDDLLKRMESKD